MKNFEIGQKVRVKLWNGIVVARVTKVGKSTVTLDVFDDAGRSLTVTKEVAQVVPTLSDIGYAVGMELH